jgi:hypothetical protein
MMLSQKKRWSIVALAGLLVVALGTVVWRTLREPEPVYLGKPVRVWLRLAVLRQDFQADACLHEALRTADPVSKAQIERELVRFVMKSLNTKDHPLWKPYNAVRTTLPRAIATVMPTWQEPAVVRYHTTMWLYVQSFSSGAIPPSPSLFQRAMPVLCELARSDPHKEIRHSATLTLGGAGIFSPEASQILLRALNSTDTLEVLEAARWFARNPVDPERVVPLLVKGFQDPDTRSDCATALRAYGPRAKFVVERLVTLAKNNDRRVSSDATWVLEAIDPEAAKKARAK